MTEFCHLAEKGHAWVFLVQLLHVTSAIIFVIKLAVFMPAYIMWNTALILKGYKTLLQSFLVRLGENVLEFYLL